MCGGCFEGFWPEQAHADQPPVVIDVFERVSDQLELGHDHYQRTSACSLAARAVRWRRSALLSEARGGTQFHPEDFTPEHSAGLGVLRNFFALAALEGLNPDRSPPGETAAGIRPGATQPVRPGADAQLLDVEVFIQSVPVALAGVA